MFDITAPLEKLDVNKHYRIKDKQAYISASVNNKKVYDTYTDEGIIEFEEVDAYGGWCDGILVIAVDELHLIVAV